MRTHFGFVEPLEARRLLSGVSLVQSTGTGGVAVQGGGDFLAAVHDTTFFVAARDGQWSLWVQQNAQSESHPLLLPNDSPYPPQKLIAHANPAFIFKYQELWSSDGTTKGTKKIVFPDDVYSVSEVGGRLLVSLGNPYGGGSCYIRDDSTGIFHKIVNTSGHSLPFDFEEART